MGTLRIRIMILQRRVLGDSKGDLVLIDMWGKLDQPESVYYDITWTGYCGAHVRR